MKIRDLSHSEQPREKMLKNGVSTLSNAEIIAILLGTGTRDKSAINLAMEILGLDKRGLRFLAHCSPEELLKVNGLGTAKACNLIAAIELGKRLSTAPVEDRHRISCASDISRLFMERLRYENREHFICILINSKGEVIEEFDVSIGDLTSAISHPREVFAQAVRRSASSVAFVHNHPSGDPTPSAEDIATTKRLTEAGNILGIIVLDHIIIGDGTFSSLKGLNLM